MNMTTLAKWLSTSLVLLVPLCAFIAESDASVDQGRSQSTRVNIEYIENDKVIRSFDRVLELGKEVIIDEQETVKITMDCPQDRLELSSKQRIGGAGAKLKLLATSTTKGLLFLEISYNISKVVAHERFEVSAGCTYFFPKMESITGLIPISSNNGVDILQPVARISNIAYQLRIRATPVN